MEYFQRPTGMCKLSFTGPGRRYYCLSLLLPPNSTLAYWTDGFMEALYFACGLLSSEGGKKERSRRLEGCIKLLRVASGTSMVEVASLCSCVCAVQGTRTRMQACKCKVAAHGGEISASFGHGWLA